MTNNPHIHAWWANLQDSDREELLTFLYTLYHYCANHTNRESHALHELKRKLTEQYQNVLNGKDAQIEFLRDQFNLRIESSVKEVVTRLDTIAPIILNQQQQSAGTGTTTYEKGKEGEANFDQLIHYQYGDDIGIEDISLSKNCGDRVLTLFEDDIQIIVEIKNHSKTSQLKNRRLQYDVLQQNLQHARQQINEHINVAICCIMTDVPIGRGKEYLDIIKCSYENNRDGICIVVSGAQLFPHNLYATIEMAKTLHFMLEHQSSKTDTLLNIIRVNFPTLQKIQANLQKWERTVNQLRVDINHCERNQLNPFVYSLLTYVDASSTKNQEKLVTVLDILKSMMEEKGHQNITRDALELACKTKGIRATTLIKNYGGIRVLKNMAINQLKEDNINVNNVNNNIPLPPLQPLQDLPNLPPLT
jgi:hypothetical protein